jgi:site-specific recombinase XerD
MIDEVYEAFLQEYEMQKCVGFCSEVIDGYTNFVFVTANGTIYAKSSVNKVICRITDEYNAEEKVNAEQENREPLIIPHFSVHNLRHTFCTRVCENETNIKVIQSLMGHSSIATTMNIYAEVTNEKKQEVMANLRGKIIL